MMSCLLLLAPLFGQVSGRSSLETLRSALTLPEEAALQCEWNVRWYTLDETEFRESLEHANRLYTACWIPQDEEEEQALALQRELANPGTPGCLRRLMGRDWEHRKSERLLIRGGAWNSCTSELSDKGVPTCSTRLYSPDPHEGGLVEWAYVDGVRTRTVRHPAPDEQAFSVGTMYLHEMWTGQVLVLLELAGEQDAITFDGETLFFDVDIRSMRSAKRLRRYETLNAAFQYPGMVRGTFRVGTDRATLELEWRDCDDSLLETTRMTWQDEGSFPCELEQQVFAPGTGLLIEEFKVSIESLPDPEAALAGLAWKPEPGERIQDMRYLYAVAYPVRPDGSLPSDGWVAGEAEALGAEIGQLRPSQIVSADVPRPATSRPEIPGSSFPRKFVLAGACAASLMLLLATRSRHKEVLS